MAFISTLKYIINNRNIFKGKTDLKIMLKIKKISEIIGKKVYTDTGDFFGEIEEVNLVENKIDGWRIRVVGSLGGLLGGARGVIIPHQYVKSIGDVFIISKSALPSHEELEESSQDNVEA